MQFVCFFCFCFLFVLFFVNLYFAILEQKDVVFFSFGSEKPKQNQHMDFLRARDFFIAQDKH